MPEWKEIIYYKEVIAVEKIRIRVKIAVKKTTKRRVIITSK